MQYPCMEIINQKFAKEPKYIQEKTGRFSIDSCIYSGDIRNDLRFQLSQYLARKRK